MACVIRLDWRSSPARVCCGPRSTSATTRAMRFHPDLVTILGRARISAGRTASRRRGAADSWRRLLRHHPAHHRHPGAQRAARAGVLPAFPDIRPVRRAARFLESHSAGRAEAPPHPLRRRPAAARRRFLKGWQDRMAIAGAAAGRRRRSRRQPDRQRRSGRPAVRGAYNGAVERRRGGSSDWRAATQSSRPSAPLVEQYRDEGERAAPPAAAALQAMRDAGLFSLWVPARSRRRGESTWRRRCGWWRSCRAWTAPSAGT